MSYKQLNKRKDDLDIDDLDVPKRGEYSLEEESYKSGDKPRSILRDNPSGTKANRRIVINENANELHSISKVTSQTSAEKEKETASFRGQFDSNAYSQSDSGYSPLSKSENSRSGNKYDKYELSEDEGQEKLDYKVDALKNYAKEQISNSYGKKANTSSDTNAGQNEFQKAHIRKLQQERESELYGKFLKTSAQKVREKWLEEKQKSSPKSHLQNTDQSKSHQDRSLNDYSGKSLSAVQSAETYSKFSRIENKITDLEKDLESYQKTMKDKYDKEQASQEDFEKAYNRVDSKVKILKKELDKSLDRYESKQSDPKRRTEDDEEQDEGSEQEEEEEEEEAPVKSSKGSKRSNNKKSVEFSHHEERVSSKASPKKKVSSAVKSLKKLTTEYDDELQRLKEENEALKRALKTKDYNASRKAPRPASANKSTKVAIEGKIEKERELLKTLDRLKRKVWTNISKKIKDEKDKENNKLKEDIEAKTFGKSYVPAPAYGTTYHDILLTKIYGDQKTRKTNAVLLHKGIPVSHASKKK